MNNDTDREVDFHQVSRVAEVRYTAANELLDAGWLLHDIYFSADDNEYRSHYVMLCLQGVVCPQCGGAADVEVVDDGRRVRYICTRECS